MRQRDKDRIARRHAKRESDNTLLRDIVITHMRGPSEDMTLKKFGSQISKLSHYAVITQVDYERDFLDHGIPINGARMHISLTIYL